jgi:hypothetical protein
MGQQSSTAKDTKDTKEKNSLTAKNAKAAKNSMIRTRKVAKEPRQSRHWHRHRCAGSRNCHIQYGSGFDGQ